MTTHVMLSRSSRPDGTHILAARGEIDLSNSDQFGTAIDAALNASSEPLTVDLTEVEYLDSAGLNILFDHAERIEIIVGPLLAPLLTVCGLDQLTTVHGLPSADPGPQTGERS